MCGSCGVPPWRSCRRTSLADHDYMRWCGIVPRLVCPQQGQGGDPRDVELPTSSRHFRCQGTVPHPAPMRQGTHPRCANRKVNRPQQSCFVVSVFQAVAALQVPALRRQWKEYEGRPRRDADGVKHVGHAIHLLGLGGSMYKRMSPVTLVRCPALPRPAPP